MPDSKKNEYEIGYGKPPKSGQFRKGQSGNPKGRPKGMPNLNRIIQQLLSEQVTIAEGGKKRRVSTLVATLMRLKEKALKGDMRAIERLLVLAGDMAAELEANQAARSYSAADADIMERYRQDVLKAQGEQKAEGVGDG